MQDMIVVGVHKKNNKLVGLFFAASPKNSPNSITVHMEMYVLYASQDTRAMNIFIRHFDKSKQITLNVSIRIEKRDEEYFIKPSSDPEIQKTIDLLPESKPHRDDFI